MMFTEGLIKATEIETLSLWSTAAGCTNYELSRIHLASANAVNFFKHGVAIVCVEDRNYFNLFVLSSMLPSISILNLIVAAYILYTLQSRSLKPLFF